MRVCLCVVMCEWILVLLTLPVPWAWSLAAEFRPTNQPAAIKYAVSKATGAAALLLKPCSHITHKVRKKSWQGEGGREGGLFMPWSLPWICWCLNSLRRSAKSAQNWMTDTETEWNLVKCVWECNSKRRKPAGLSFFFKWHSCQRKEMGSAALFALLFVFSLIPATQTGQDKNWCLH